MEDIINKIIEIDNLTLEMKKKTDNKVKEEKIRIAEKIKIIKEEGMKEAKEEAEEKYRVILESAQKEVESINHKADEEYKRIEEIYKRHSSRLAEKVFKKIL